MTTDTPHTVASSAASGTLRGALQKGPFDADGYVIARLVTDAGDSVTVKGSLAGAAYGETYELVGEWQEHAKFGRQFAFSNWKLILPTSADGIRRYLVDTCKWVGPAVAKRITDAFGEASLDVLRTDPARVAAEIDGITAERASEISNALEVDAELGETRVQLETILAGHRMPRRAMQELLRRYGKNAPARLRSNPYRLTELAGIGWATADQIAVGRLGYPHDGPRRLAAACAHVFDEHARDGSTWLTRSELEQRVARLTRHAPGVVVDALIADGEIVPVPTGGPMTGTLQARAFAESEATITARVRELSASPVEPIFPDLDGLADDQREAVATVCAHPVAILTGPPGTGKTYVVKTIVRAARDAGLSVALGAPTGKAAKRVTESLDAGALGEGRTIHSLLGATYDDESGSCTYGRTREAPLDETFIVIDEFSMVDTLLAAALLRAVRDGARLLIVGDQYQLSSVGAGAVLRDLIAAGVPHAALRDIKRNTGDLVCATHAIARGEAPRWSATLDIPAGANLRAIGAGEDRLAEVVLDLHHRLAARGLDPAWDVQVLSPLNEKGPFSVDRLNALLGPALNDAPTVPRSAFRVGDKVLRCKNGKAKLASNGGGCETNVVNGDLGRVVAIDSSDYIVQHWFPDRLVAYPKRDHHLRHAWALTLHKMQGSSAPVVILPVHRSFTGPLWSREWVYTALSRAEQACLVVGDPDLIRFAIPRQKNSERRTLLAQRVAEALR